MTAIGPFETAEQVHSVPAVAAAYDASRASHRRGVLAEHGHRIICEAVTEAEVVLGAYEHQLCAWLAGFGPEYPAVFARIITAAHEAGVLAGRTGAR